MEMSYFRYLHVLSIHSCLYSLIDDVYIYNTLLFITTANTTSTSTTLPLLYYILIPLLPLLLLLQALSLLENLTQLNLSENFLNGPLSEHAGKLTQLQVLNMDINNVTMLCPDVRNWNHLKIFTISDNSLSGKQCVGY